MSSYFRRWLDELGHVRSTACRHPLLQVTIDTVLSSGRGRAMQSRM